MTNTAQIDALLEQMTLGEKIGQMTQPEKNSIPAEDVTTYAIGSVLSGGGGNPKPNTVENWAAMVATFQEAALQSRLGIPLIYGVDAVHGHNNVHGAVIFPHNIGLGATRDADLVERIAQVTAKEVLATNVHWDFAPAVSVPQDIRWGRTYEGYSENSDLVTALGAACVRGLQQDDLSHPQAVLASVKHFVGDGGARWGTTRQYEWLPHMWQAPDERWSIDQGTTAVNEHTLRTLHLAPYYAAIEAGALNIMVSYTSWGGFKMHGHHYLLTEVLKEEMGFEGFLVSDWMAISQLSEDYYTCVVESINAGLDMVMVPFDYKLFIRTLTRAVENGDVAEERIDDAVRRILRAKFALNLFERPFPSTTFLPDFGSAAHRAVAREAVQKSAVLLKNDGNTLPISPDTHRILVAGAGAEDIGMQCGGWSIEWQGGRGTITPGATVLDGIKALVGPETAVAYNPTATFAAGAKAEVGIVVVGEPPYTEGEGDRADLSLSADDVALLAKMRPLVDKLVVVMLSGRPLIITDQLDQWDALVAAWLPGSEGDGIADLLFGKAPFTGRLSYTWPRHMGQIPRSAITEDEEPLFAFGFGLTK
ncbi:MAG: glycoside hydrolase family 3 C-terminal domain-containing protein [Anaerolineales bacterium]|nr:glycoside hydrolase family 3 C-terminal domain-containing protein [Anaerolineales bacterium]